MTSQFLKSKTLVLKDVLSVSVYSSNEYNMLSSHNSNIFETSDVIKIFSTLQYNILSKFKVVKLK